MFQRFNSFCFYYFSGCAYIYEFSSLNGYHWNQVAYLQPPVPVVASDYGASVGFDQTDTYAIVGSPGGEGLSAFVAIVSFLICY